MKPVQTDRITDLDSNIEYYVTEVNELGTFGVPVGSVDLKNSERKLIGNFKLASIIYGEYTTKEELIQRHKDAQQIIILT